MATESWISCDWTVSGGGWYTTRVEVPPAESFAPREWLARAARAVEAQAAARGLAGFAGFAGAIASAVEAGQPYWPLLREEVYGERRFAADPFAWHATLALLEGHFFLCGDGSCRRPGNGWGDAVRRAMADGGFDLPPLPAGSASLCTFREVGPRVYH